MGNTSSDITDNIKTQANTNDLPCYKLVNMKGGGELIDLLKNAKSTNHCRDLNAKIKNKIENFLYNDGKGQYFSIESCVNVNMNKKWYETDDLPKSESNTLQRAIYWDIDKRGAVGETALHLCLLNCTSLHNELARRLVQICPNLVNDIYLGDEFYGESPLHIAIVNEDPLMVSFLVLYGANVNERCFGKFFLPEDQKNKMKDSLLHEYPILPKESNFNGFSYFGEYPLSFAAILNQEECVRLLIANGADVNIQDSNGNTVLHMLVIHDNLNMLIKMVDFGAKLSIKNAQGLTPLTLSAKLARKDIFNWIVEKIQCMYWVYGDVSCAAYPIIDIDSIGIDGCTNLKSALYLIVNGDSDAHKDMMQGIVKTLLQEKWKRFVKKKFFTELFFYGLFYSFIIISIILQHNYFVFLMNQKNCTNSTSTMTCLLNECRCAYLYPIDNNGYVRLFFDILVLLFAIKYLITVVIEFHTEKYEISITSLKKTDFARLLFLISCILLLLILPIRAGCLTNLEDYLMVICLLLNTIYMLYIIRAVRIVGLLVLMALKVIKTGLKRFILLYFVFLMGFSQALYIVFEFDFNSTKYMFNTPFASMLDLFVISFGDYERYYKALTKTKYSIFGKFIFHAYLIIVVILLINILIATMVKTISMVDYEREWEIQWAQIVLSIERSFFPKQRLKFQKKYTLLILADIRAMVVFRKQNDFEREKTLKQYFAFRKIINDRDMSFDSEL